MMLRSASSIDWHAFLEENPVADFVVLPNYYEDQAVFQKPLNTLVHDPTVSLGS